MWRKLYLKGHLGLHRLNCHFHANRLLEAELNWRQKTFRVCLRHRKYEYWCLFIWLFLLREKTRAIIYLVKTLLKRMNWMLGLWYFLHSGSEHTQCCGLTLCFPCTKAAGTNLTSGTCAAGALAVHGAWGVGRAQPWQSLPENHQGSCAHLLQKVSFVPLALQCQDPAVSVMWHLPSTVMGHSGTGKQKTHLQRQLSLRALVENVVGRPALSAGKDCVSVYFINVFLLLQYGKKPQSLGTRIVQVERSNPHVML